MQVPSEIEFGFAAQLNAIAVIDTPKLASPF